MSNAQQGAWRRYNIFISSTFKDMDFERDVIKFRVIPALNRRLRDRRVELQAIDLRLGVNTSNMSEAESERKVLSVCTSCIDSARPFFIGLIGKRYGWIPPVERWNEFMAGLSDEEREILADTAGCSVTEMEIVYGALSQGSFDTSHVLFYLRDDSSYEGLPAEQLPTFCDSDPYNLQKLAALKDKVRKLFGERGGEDDRCTSYHLNYSDGHFSGDEFERIVTEQLAAQIEAETAREEEEGSSTWWAQEKELEESTLLRLLPGSIELDVYDDEDAPEEGEDDSSDVAVWYVQGFGASTHMAQDYVQWEEDSDVIRLLGVFGLSEYSRSMRPVLARWIHELAGKVGREDIPDDEQLLGKMPQTELYGLFENLVKEAAEDNYLYIYLDDVEALETTSPKDLYMTWLDHVKDDVNVMVNLQDGSEAREKFLEQHSYLSSKLMLGVEADKDAALELIENYEKTYFLELPEKIKKQMLKSVGGKKTLAPLKVHSVFRIFESLTQEDFAQIRDRRGSQIDAINGYLEELWKKLPETPYDIMTFMSNTIMNNLGIGKQMQDAVWAIASAPGGLRESDVAHFAGEDWDVVQFYRAMNFLQDFFYEDPARHLWRTKYLTRVGDGLGAEQKRISEYLLTLDKKDSLRETMGLYFALGGCEPSHFAGYVVEGDYLHGQQMKDLTAQHGPQIRQLLREGFLDSENFKDYCLALPAGQRLQLMLDVITALADLQEDRVRIHALMAGWLGDIDIDSLGGVDSFAFASILAGQRDNEPLLERALEAARHCKQLGFETSDQLISMVTSLLILLYRQNGKNDKADALQNGGAADHNSPKERFTALYPMIAQAGAASSGVRNTILREFFKKYYEIVDELELNDETFEARFKSSKLIINACMLLQKDDKHEWIIIALMDFITSMRLFYLAGNFFSSPEPLELFLQFHIMLATACSGWLSEKGLAKDWDEDGLHPIQRMQALATVATAEGAELLKDADPDNSWIKELRGPLSGLIAGTDGLREEFFDEDFGLKDIDKKIKDIYDEFLKTVD